MRVGNFCARFLKAPKIGDLKSSTLSCNARILRRQKSQ
nr:MAG TPA: Albumin I chain a [Caudoviricetes sp.]